MAQAVSNPESTIKMVWRSKADLVDSEAIDGSPCKDYIVIHITDNRNDYNDPVHMNND